MNVNDESEENFSTLKRSKPGSARGKSNRKNKQIYNLDS